MKRFICLILCLSILVTGCNSFRSCSPASLNETAKLYIKTAIDASKSSRGETTLDVYLEQGITRKKLQQAVLDMYCMGVSETVKTAFKNDILCHSYSKLRIGKNVLSVRFDNIKMHEYSCYGVKNSYMLFERDLKDMLSVVEKSTGILNKEQLGAFAISYVYSNCVDYGEDIKKSKLDSLYNITGSSIRHFGSDKDKVQLIFKVMRSIGLNSFGELDTHKGVWWAGEFSRSYATLNNSDYSCKLLTQNGKKITLSDFLARQQKVIRFSVYNLEKRK